MLWSVCKCVRLPHSTSVGMKTQPESKCPELLANYCDMLLRKTPLSKKLTSEEIELKLKEVVSLRTVRLKLVVLGNCLFFTLFFHTDLFFHGLCLQLLVLKYVQNKDVFMRYHKAHLTRRLILDISADSEIEENMVEWLRVSYTFLQFLVRHLNAEYILKIETKLSTER